MSFPRVVPKRAEAMNIATARLLVFTYLKSGVTVDVYLQVSLCVVFMVGIASNHSYRFAARIFPAVEKILQWPNRGELPERR